MNNEHHYSAVFAVMDIKEAIAAGLFTALIVLIFFLLRKPTVELWHKIHTKWPKVPDAPNWLVL